MATQTTAQNKTPSRGARRPNGLYTNSKRQYRFLRFAERRPQCQHRRERKRTLRSPHFMASENPLRPGWEVTSLVDHNVDRSYDRTAPISMDLTSSKFDGKCSLLRNTGFVQRGRTIDLFADPSLTRQSSRWTCYSTGFKGPSLSSWTTNVSRGLRWLVIWKALLSRPLRIRVEIHGRNAAVFFGYVKISWVLCMVPYWKKSLALYADCCGMADDAHLGKTWFWWDGFRLTDTLVYGTNILDGQVVVRGTETLFKDLNVERPSLLSVTTIVCSSESAKRT